MSGFSARAPRGAQCVRAVQCVRGGRSVCVQFSVWGTQDQDGPLTGVDHGLVELAFKVVEREAAHIRARQGAH